MKPAARPREFLIHATLLLCVLSAAGTLRAQYPKIVSLNASDPVFRQLQQDLEEAYRDEASGAYSRLPGPGSPPFAFSLSLYSLVLSEDADLFSLTARLNLPYDCLAGINAIDGKTILKRGSTLLLPSRPGIFVGEEPSTELELLMASWRDPHAPNAMRVSVKAASGASSRRFVYFPGERLNPSERAWFLNPVYRYPLPKGRLTSGFGMRRSPITGEYHLHKGIDLAAPEGTSVLAARGGRVIAVGWEDALGKRIVLDHGGGWTTVYGHLSSYSVSLNDEVKSASIIGAVGSTGLSTGPHLHFEIRSGGQSVNPETMLPRLPK